MSSVIFSGNQIIQLWISWKGISVILCGLFQFFNCHSAFNLEKNPKTQKTEVAPQFLPHSVFCFVRLSLLTQTSLLFFSLYYGSISVFPLFLTSLKLHTAFSASMMGELFLWWDLMQEIMKVKEGDGQRQRAWELMDSSTYQRENELNRGVKRPRRRQCNVHEFNFCLTTLHAIHWYRKAAKRVSFQYYATVSLPCSSFSLSALSFIETQK